ncbi:MAG: hypothetical protein IT455_21240 [Planctomycetes bacterium]|nr:hypothetical protein [Planctomycetota bacterium]
MDAYTLTREQELAIEAEVAAELAKLKSPIADVILASVVEVVGAKARELPNWSRIAAPGSTAYARTYWTLDLMRLLMAQGEDGPVRYGPFVLALQQELRDHERALQGGRTTA